MNYSRNLRKKAIAKRILVSWLIVAVIVGLVCGISGYAVGTHITSKKVTKIKEQSNEQVQEKTLVYGAYDDRTFTEEIPLDWSAGDLDFKPLDCAMNEEEQEFVYYLSFGYNIEFTLVMALIEHESSFQADVVSKTDDYGLMQINKMNHQYLTDTIGITNFLDPYENVRGGMFILRKLFERYQDADMVLMCYNMGEDGAERLWDNGIYETDYTQSILKTQTEYNKQLEQ